jgi:hypothetical protein
MGSVWFYQRYHAIDVKGRKRGENVMNTEDYAIIIGLQDYPGLVDVESGVNPLQGPENDARAFKDWVVSPNGGDVPDDSLASNPIHVQMILSSQYKDSPFPSIFVAKPVNTDVQNAFLRLCEISEGNAAADKGPRIGRRLYIFMAGHGIAPSRYGEKDEKEAALLMANVRPSNFEGAYHIAGAYTASWFGYNKCFDEIFLFMDCCREDSLVAHLNTFLPKTGTATAAKRCFAFATLWSRLSREHPMADEGGRTRGVFTKTLLLGLSGAAAEPDPANPAQGLITVSSLKSFLIDNMRAFLDPAVTDAELQEPNLDYWPRGQDGRDIPIKSVPLQKFPVTIRPPAGVNGFAQVGIFQNNEWKEIASIKTIPPEWSIELPRGKYVAQIVTAGVITNKPFDVKGIEGLANKGGADVNF